MVYRCQTLEEAAVLMRLFVDLAPRCLDECYTNQICLDLFGLTWRSDRRLKVSKEEFILQSIWPQA